MTIENKPSQTIIIIYLLQKVASVVLFQLILKAISLLFILLCLISHDLTLEMLIRFCVDLMTLKFMLINKLSQITSLFIE